MADNLSSDAVRQALLKLRDCELDTGFIVDAIHSATNNRFPDTALAIVRGVIHVGIIDLAVLYDDIVTEGDVITLHSNGQVKSRYSLVDGHIDGQFNAYYPCGNPEIIATYAAGKLEGDKLKFTKTPAGLRLAAIEKYEYGKAHGLHTVYDDAGAVILSQTYRYGKLMKSTHFAPKFGSIVQTREHCVELDTDTLITYSRDKPATKTVMFNQQNKMVFTTFDKDGRVDSKSTYVNGNLVGAVTSSVDGNRNELDYYVDGVNIMSLASN